MSQTREGDIHTVIANKYLVIATGTADAAAKMSYAQAVNYDKLSKI